MVGPRSGSTSHDARRVRGVIALAGDGRRRAGRHAAAESGARHQYRAAPQLDAADSAEDGPF